ncbi:MAG: hypothetical protein B6U68_01665 [Candidatus Aenigmarchaeota archaeon ex4484_14]|nr:MAG: hypothetical protein B6U68_01665 [Candidatus Aenigmarchaeota archaeon ex4484_14]
MTHKPVEIRPPNPTITGEDWREELLGMNELLGGSRKDLENYLSKYPRCDPLHIYNNFPGMTPGIFTNWDGTITEDRGIPDKNTVRKIADEYGSLLSITSMHVARAAKLLQQVGEDKEKIIASCENGGAFVWYDSISHSFEVFYRPYDKKIEKIYNKLINEILAPVQNTCISKDFICYLNRGEEGKKYILTFEMLSNGEKKNKEFIDRVLVPFIKKKIKEKYNTMKIEKNEKGNWCLYIPSDGFKLEITATKDSIEFSSLYHGIGKDSVASYLEELFHNFIRKENDIKLPQDYIFMRFDDTPNGGGRKFLSPSNNRYRGAAINPLTRELKEEENVYSILTKWKVPEGIIKIPQIEKREHSWKFVGAGDHVSGLLPLSLWREHLKIDPDVWKDVIERALKLDNWQSSYLINPEEVEPYPWPPGFDDEDKRKFLRGDEEEDFDNKIEDIVTGLGLLTS